MQFEVSVDKLIDYSININELLLCQFLYHNSRQMYDLYLEQFDKFFNKSTIEKLIERGFLRLEDESKGFLFSNIKVTDSFINIFIEDPVEFKEASKSKNTDTIEWFDEWYNEWPAGVKSGGYYVKGDRKGCIKKMNKFIKEYPEFTKDIIIKATKDYIAAFRMKRNYDYMKLAHFFIYKDNMSTLAAYCERIKEKIDNGTYDELDNRFGRIDTLDDI